MAFFSSVVRLSSKFDFSDDVVNLSFMYMKNKSSLTHSNEEIEKNVWNEKVKQKKKQKKMK